MVNIVRQTNLLHTLLLFKISERKQKTLAAFGFKKKVMHKAEEINVDIPKEVDLEDYFKLKCLYCPLTFNSQQGLSLHLICKHER